MNQWKWHILGIFPSCTSSVVGYGIPNCNRYRLIQDAAGSLSILINLPSDTPEKNSVKFFDIIGSICTTCKLEDDYSSIVFSLRADSSFVTTMPLTNYTSPSSFSCAEPIVFIDEYKEPIAQIYSEVFSQNDIGNSFDKSLESLKDKYGLND